MNFIKHAIVLAAVVGAHTLVGCNGSARNEPAAPGKPAAAAPGKAPAAPAVYFTQYDKGGRLWVFVDPSKDLEEFKKTGEPAKSVTRLGALPGLTVKSSDNATIDAYVAGVKSGTIKLPAKPAGG